MKVIIFDLDGTIVDTMGLYEEKASELIEKFYRVDRDFAKRKYRETSGLPFLYQLNEIFPDKTMLNFQVAKMFENWKKVALADIKVGEDIKEMLYDLKEKGFVLALSTNNTYEVAKNMVEGCPFDYILAWDWGTFTKGEPHFRWIEEKTGIKRAEFLFVGDSRKDEEIAEKCGVAFLKTDVSSVHRQLQVEVLEQVGGVGDVSCG